MIQQINNLVTKNYWTSSLGLARSFLALCTLLTLVFNDNEIMFAMNPAGSLLQEHTWNIFGIFGSVQTGKITSIVILLVVISGYFPRYTAILHFWVAFSYYTGSYLIEGGDHIASIISCLLSPILLLDNRKNHWSQSIKNNRPYYANLLAFSFYFAIILQVAVIYFHSSVGKFNVTEWYNGTAVYYWINDPVFSPSEMVYSFLMWIFKNPYVVLIFTWGTLICELLLFSRLFSSNKKYIRFVFWVGLLFHAGIVILFGLVSFFCASVGALILYTLWEKDLSLNRFKGIFKFRPNVPTSLNAKLLLNDKKGIK